MDSPTSQQRYNFFGPLLMDVASPAIMVDPSLKAARDARHQEVLKVAPPPERTQPSEEERARSQKSDEQSLRAMRMEMRELLARLINDRKYMVGLPARCLWTAVIFSNDRDPAPFLIVAGVLESRRP